MRGRGLNWLKRRRRKRNSPCGRAQCGTSEFWPRQMASTSAIEPCSTTKVPFVQDSPDLSSDAYQPAFPR
jgi:hypothetical protein